MGATIYEKSFMNFLIKLIYPRNDRRAFLLDGRGITSITLNLSRYIENPYSDTTCLNNFP